MTIHGINTYSWREFRNTLDVYSRSKLVLERLRASLLGLENANAVPRADLLFAPMSGMNQHLGY